MNMKQKIIWIITCLIVLSILILIFPFQAICYFSGAFIMGAIIIIVFIVNHDSFNNKNERR